MPKVHAKNPPRNSAIKQRNAATSTRLYQVRIINDGGRAGVPLSGVTKPFASKFADQFNRAMAAIGFKARAKVQIVAKA